MIEIESAATRHPACLSTLSSPVGAPAKSKRNTTTGRNCLLLSSLLSLEAGAGGRVVRYTSSCRSQLARSSRPALSSLPPVHLDSAPDRESSLALEKACIFFSFLLLIFFFFFFFFFLPRILFPGAVSFVREIFGWCGWLVIFLHLLFGSCARAPSFLLPVDSGGHSVEHLPCGVGSGGSWFLGNVP